MNAEVKMIVDATNFGRKIDVQKLFKDFSEESVGFFCEENREYYIIDPAVRTVYTLDSHDEYFGELKNEQPFEMYLPIPTE